MRGIPPSVPLEGWSGYGVLDCMSDECSCSPPLRNRPQWKAGVSVCNTIIRFIGDAGSALPEPDVPMIVAWVYRVVGTPRSWLLSSPETERLDPLETLKSRPLWATLESSRLSRSAVLFREKALIPFSRKCPNPVGLGGRADLIGGCTHRVDGGGSTEQNQSTFPRTQQLFQSMQLCLSH